MMRMSIARRARESRNEHIGTERPDHANHVAQRDLVPTPLFKCFFRGLGKSEIGNTREALLDSVILVGSHKLQRAENAKLIGESVTRFVLAALTASQGA